MWIHRTDRWRGIPTLQFGLISWGIRRKDYEWALKSSLGLCGRMPGPLTASAGLSVFICDMERWLFHWLVGKTWFVMRVMKCMLRDLQICAFLCIFTSALCSLTEPKAGGVWGCGVAAFMRFAHKALFIGVSSSNVCITFLKLIFAFRFRLMF